MQNRQKEIADFDARIAQIAARLSTRSVALEKKDYAAHAFGSWQIIAGTKKKRLHFTYDGKDSYLMYHDAAVTPKDHRDVQHRRFRTWEGEDPLVFVEEELTRVFSSQ